MTNEKGGGGSTNRKLFNEMDSVLRDRPHTEPIREGFGSGLSSKAPILKRILDEVEDAEEKK